jgi:hypothetical protein
MDEINIIPRYGGVIVHDCWASYFSYARCEDALCGAHLLREDKVLSEAEYAKLDKRYRTILTCGLAELPARPERPSGKRGQLAQSQAQNLWDRLKAHETAILLFAQRAEVPFTNNRAERERRMGKVKQEVSGCFRREQYAAAYCRFSSYLQTMACKGTNPLTAIQLALAGEIPASAG